jgi:hypothetical protein
MDVGDHDREDLREALARLLKAVVDADTVYYYQVRWLCPDYCLKRLYISSH